MKKLGILITVLGILLLAAAAQLSSQTDATKQPITLAQIDKPAPDFALSDVDGKQHKLSDYKGKIVVLEWVNFECPFVKKHYSSGNMQSLQGNYTKKDVVWLSICSSAPGKQGNFPIPDLKKHMSEVKAVPTAYLIDSVGTVGKMYGAKTTPNMYVVDSKGTLRYAGAIDDTPSTDKDDIPKATNYVRNALESLMAGKEIAVKTSTPYGCGVKYQ